MISLESYPRHCEDLVCRVIDDEVVILTTDSCNVHSLNKVGSVIWELADGTRSIREMVTRICENFDVPFEKALANVMEFQAQMVDKNLVEIV
jgi:hypothetical protein